MRSLFEPPTAPADKIAWPPPEPAKSQPCDVQTCVDWINARCHDEILQMLLTSRRGSDKLDFLHEGIVYTATWSRFPDGRLAELFLKVGKPGASPARRTL